MARKSGYRRASSSNNCYTSRPSSKPCYTSTPGNKSKPNSTVQCLPFSNIHKIILPAYALDALTSLKKFKFHKTVKIMYNDVRLHLSQFIGWRENRDFDVFNYRKKVGNVSKSIFNYDVHRRKAGEKSKPTLNYDVYDHQDKVGYKSKPNFSYQCYPFSHINKCHCEDGNKIIMPASALDAVISMRNIEYSLAFKIINPLLHKFSHCGVLEFSGKEGNVYLPNWMMNSLLLQQGQLVNIEYAPLSKGTFLKIQPHSTKFIMNLSDPKEAMERILKDFACVTIGDTIMVNHENQSYFMNIIQTRPNKAVSLIETDCELEFTKPLDHKEPEKIKPNVEQVKDAPSLENDAVSRLLDEDDKKLIVSLRKYSRKPVRDVDGNCSAARKKQKQRTLKTSRRR